MATTDTMLAYRLLDWGTTPELVEVPVPEPGPGQVRVRVAGCGLCHSDLTMASMPAEVGQVLGWRIPFTLGHEIAGWVDAVGPGVRVHQEGDAVVVSAPSSCGSCRWCELGREASCSAGSAGRGYGRDGGLARFVVVDDADRVAVGLDGVDPRVAGPLSDAGATAHHAVVRVLDRVHPDAAVLVIGAGGLGAFAIQLAVELGEVPVVAVDPNPIRRANALEMGAYGLVDGVGGEAGETGRRLADVLDGRPVDGIVDLVGSDATLAVAMGELAPGGSLAVVGAGGGRLRGPVFGGLPRDAEVFSFQGSDLADLRAVVALAERGRLRIDVEVHPLPDVAQAYRSLDEGQSSGRIVVQP